MLALRFFLLCFCLALSLCVVSEAQGPKKIAKGDRNLWQESLNNQAGFDKASRVAILIYTLNLQDFKTSENKSLNRASVKKWLDKESNLSLQNYQLATKNCAKADWTCGGDVSNFEELIAQARALSIPANLRNWQENLHQFVKVYIGEQIRLASKFPATTSEIDLFNSNEWNGDNLGDRKFFLTFDDGPTAVGGNTDGVLEMLTANKKTAVFFVLGENFQNRLNSTNAANLAGIYQNQCVALHGWQHLSHAKWTQWQTSVTRTQSLLQATFANASNYLPLFRPPYGQRTAESGAFFQNHNLQVALWNLDSQDWNAQVDADDVINRMINLMLIKRHGVLLFHDVHPKAKIAVPVIIEEFGNAIEWGDCHQISETPKTAEVQTTENKSINILSYYKLMFDFGFLNFEK